MFEDWMDVTITLEDREVNVKDLLFIDLTDLNHEYASQSALYAYVGVLVAMAEKVWNAAVRDRKKVEAAAFGYYKNDLESIPKGGRSVSDTLANHLVSMDDEAIAARKLEIDMQYKYNVLRSIVTAFYMRASMLQSLGANLRHEEDMTDMAVYKPGLDRDLKEHIRGGHARK